MSSAAERAAQLRELDAIERRLRTLISMIEAPVTDIDGLVRAAAELSSQELDAQKLLARFEGAGAAEVASLKRRLGRLVDLEAVARAACRGELVRTAEAMDRVRHVRTQLDTLRSVDGAGETLDYTS